MNKALLAIPVALIVVAGGLWLSIRRQPSGTPLPDIQGPFLVETSGPGHLIRLQDPQPLRALHWVQPLPGGLMAAQVLTQSDRQEVVFFREGQLASEVLVVKPFGIAEGFWRFAVLKEVADLPGGEAVLLYGPADPASGEPSVAIAVDVAHGDVRWTHRGPWSRMALAPGKDASLFFFGGPSPIQRLPLGAASGGEAGRAGPNAAAKAVELPAEIASVDDLLPTGGSGFLVSHAKGLSAYASATGWQHGPAPDAAEVPCQSWHGTLAQAGGKLWWQANPGQVHQVKADGTLLNDRQPTFPEGDGFSPDAHLLRLLGGNPKGELWFALATPANPASPPAPAATGDPAQGMVPAASPETPAPVFDWLAYSAQGLDRIYRWDPRTERLERLSWAAAWAGLKAPAEVPQPGAAQALRPGSGALLLEAPRSAWWLPLQALPFQRL